MHVKTFHKISRYIGRAGFLLSLGTFETYELYAGGAAEFRNHRSCHGSSCIFCDIVVYGERESEF